MQPLYDGLMNSTYDGSMHLLYGRLMDPPYKVSIQILMIVHAKCLLCVPSVSLYGVNVSFLSLFMHLHMNVNAKSL